MAYSKTNWQDLPNTTTPINAIRLNNIETGIENNDKRLNGTSPAGKMVVDSIRSKNMFSFNYEVTDTSVTHIVTNNTIIQTNAGAYARSNWKITGLEIGTTYTLSCNYTNNNSCSIRMSIFDSTNTTLITETSTTTSTSGNFILTFTATETSIYIRFVTNTTSSGNTNSVTFSNIQLETGSQATNFMPYQNLDGMENYSVEEQVIGTFLGKPLYRKVIEYTGTMSASLSIAHNISNIDNIINYHGYIISANSRKPFPTIYSPNQANYGCSLYELTTTNLNLILGTWVTTNATKISIVVEYTKTTD